MVVWPTANDECFFGVHMYGSGIKQL